MSDEASQDAEGCVRWGLTLDVTVEGIELPFRLRVVTDDEEKMLEALCEFQLMIVEKVKGMP